MFSGLSSYYSAQSILQVATTVCWVLAIAGAVVLFFLFLSPRNEGKFRGFLGWMYEFLHFRKLLLETLLRILYMAAAIFLVLYGFLYIFVGLSNFGLNLLTGLGIAVVGNVLLRLSFEFIMLLVTICRNVSEINRKMGGSASSSVPPLQPEKKPASPVQPQAAPKAQPNPVQNAPSQAPAQPQGPAANQSRTGQTPPSGVFVPPVQGEPNAKGGAVVFCRNCGKQFRAENEVCPFCGTKRKQG